MLKCYDVVKIWYANMLWSDLQFIKRWCAWRTLFFVLSELSSIHRQGFWHCRCLTAKQTWNIIMVTDTSCFPLWVVGVSPRGQTEFKGHTAFFNISLSPGPSPASGRGPHPGPNPGSAPGSDWPFSVLDWKLFFLFRFLRPHGIPLWWNTESWPWWALRDLWSSEVSVYGCRWVIN